MKAGSGLREPVALPRPEEPAKTSRLPLARLLKTLYVVNDLSIGGAEMMLYKLLAETDRERFEPVVISLVNQGALREQIEALGIRVHTIGMKPGWPSPLGLWRLTKLLRRLQPDVILGWMYHSCLAAQLASVFSFPRKPVVWSIHYCVDTLVNEKRLTAAVIKACACLSRMPARIIFVSQSGQAQHEILGYQLKYSCVIPNGIDAKLFLPSASARASVQAELGLAENDLLIGMVSRFHLMKDHANFLRAAALLLKARPQVHFLLSGRGVDQKNRTLSQLIQELGLAGRVHLLGERHDIPRLMASLDIFSLSSSYGESFPNVIGEAMACEVPCVVTDVGDAKRIVGPTGRVVPPRDAEAMAGAWQEMIDLRPDERLALGQAGRERVIENFALKSVVARYQALYENLLAQEAAAAADLTHGPGPHHGEEIKTNAWLSPPQ